MLRLWLLTILYGALAVANVARGLLAIRIAPVFADQSLALPLPLLSIVYTAWGIAFAITLIYYRRRSVQGGKRARRPERARKVVLGVALGYQVTVWLIYLLGMRASYARSLWARNLLLSALFIVAVVLLTTRDSEPET